MFVCSLLRLSFGKGTEYSCRLVSVPITHIVGMDCRANVYGKVCRVGIGLRRKPLQARPFELSSVCLSVVIGLVRRQTQPAECNPHALASVAPSLQIESTHPV